MTKTILVIDDDPDVHLLFKAHLEGAGYRVLCAADGMSGVMAASRQRPDLILLDLGLPAGGGEAALERLRKLQPLAHIPVVIVSGRESGEWAERTRALGASGYLEKPIAAESLLATVRDSLREVAAPMPAAPGVTAPAAAAATCPHCGGTVARLDVTLGPEAIEALTRGLRPPA